MICLCFVSSRKELSFSLFAMMLIPMAATLTLLSLLCFWFDPKRSLQNTEMRGVAENSLYEKEIDEQYKFSRTLCLSGGIILLAYLFYAISGVPKNQTSSLFFWIAYFAAIMHLLIFVIYITFRNIQEEKTVNLSLFQITFFTVALLAGIVVTGGRIAADPGLRNGSLIYRCEADPRFVPKDAPPQVVARGPAVRSDDALFSCDPEKVEKHVADVKAKKLDQEPDMIMLPEESITISKNKVLFWYFLFHVFLFKSFWVRRLRQIVEVRIVG